MNWVAIPCYRSYRSWLLSLSCGHTRKVTALLHPDLITCLVCDATQVIRRTTLVPQASRPRNRHVPEAGMTWVTIFRYDNVPACIVYLRCGCQRKVYGFAYQWDRLSILCCVSGHGSQAIEKVSELPVSCVVQ